MDVVIYARFSSHAQNEQSIEGQLKACYEFTERQGYTVIREYIDRALSGTTDKRPDFLQMIEDSKKKLFSGVVVYQLDRFSRNRYDSAIYKAKLKMNGVRVLSARENITDDASGVITEAVLEGLAEYYSIDLSQKIRRGMDINAQKCLCIGGSISLGYKVDAERRFAIDENAAPVVVKIYEQYASGQTVAQICEYLNRQQVKTSKGGDFNKNSLRTILTNKRYVGIYTYKGTEVPGGMPRIVSDELFKRVQDIMSKNKMAPARSRAKEEYLLTTKLFCGHCKEMMTGMSGTSKTGVKHSYYICNGRKKKVCNKRNVSKDYIENLVVNFARAQLTDSSIKKIATAVAKLSEKEKNSPNQRRLAGLLHENEKQKGNLLEALKNGNASPTAAGIVFAEIDKLDKTHSEIEKEIALEAARSVSLTAPEILFFLQRLRDGDINDMRYRRLLITVLVKAVYLYDDRFTIIFNASETPVEITGQLVLDVETNAKEFVYEEGCSTTPDESEPLSFGRDGRIRSLSGSP